LATRVIGYIRVSSEQQRDEGVSLDAQRAKLHAYALALDLELVVIDEDAGYSAKSVHARPGLLRALGRLEAGEADGVLVVKLDRLTRSVRDLGDLVERYFASRFSLLSVSDSIDTRTASGRLILNVLTSVAQWEREATGERTRDALAHLKSEGILVGGVPLGLRRTDEIDGEGRRVVVPVPDELNTVERARALRADGSSLRSIARILREEAHVTKRGGRWDATTVAKVLRRTSPGIAAQISARNDCSASYRRTHSSTDGPHRAWQCAGLLDGDMSTAPCSCSAFFAAANTKGRQHVEKLETDRERRPSRRRGSARG
jgi:DNA invertase Pin-like site-specific DNA recombinase